MKIHSKPVSKVVLEKKRLVYPYGYFILAMLATDLTGLYLVRHTPRLLRVIDNQQQEQPVHAFHSYGCFPISAIDDSLSVLCTFPALQSSRAWRPASDFEDFPYRYLTRSRTAHQALDHG